MAAFATSSDIVSKGQDEIRHLDPNNAYDGSAMAQRKCTDLPCLVLFLTYLGGMIYVTNYAIQHGNPRALTHGYNYKGELCGVDVEVLNKPLIYWCGAGGTEDNGHPSSLDLQFPVCVEACPTGFDTAMACLGNEKVEVQTSGAAPYETTKTIITQSLVKQMSYPTQEFGGMYCVPHFIDEHILGHDPLTLSLMGPDGPLGSAYFHVASAFGGLRRCWLVLLGAIPFAVVASYIYLFLLKYLAYPAIIISIFAMIAALLGAGVYFFLGQVLTGDSLLWWHGNNVLFRMYDDQTASELSKWVGVGFLLFGLVFTCVMGAMRDSINVATGCVIAACECIFSMPSMLLQPMTEAVIKVGTMAGLLAGMTLLLSTAEMVPEMMDVKGHVVGGLSRTFTFTDEQKGMVAYYAFGMLWLVEISNSMSQFVVSYAVILWYYHAKPKGLGPSVPLIRGVIVGCVFHLGTIACGAFLISTLRVIRIVLMWLSRQAKADGNRVGAIIAGCCTCCITLVQRYVEFLTKNAYIDVALSSTPFLTAAQNSFGFLTADTSKVAILNGACFIVSTGVVTGVFVLTGALTWLLVTTNSRWTDPTSSHYVEDPYFVAGLTASIGGSVAICFMVLFDHTADTLLYIFLWNRSHGHNTVAKYCPDSLMQLMEYRPISSAQQTTKRPDAPGIFGSTFNSFFQTSSGTKVEEQQKLLAP
eukprot:CAMPEP_0197622848 /NCGR_PEP_ID=MMETSP1338-20131121/2970_1 /TAXON_ID=43686 ORGANISM="Pelagodinium beii, Strain RCC1491" /NCGR_SAMPLE_ID=MMETSP1338 /ASSEMBLY_ACC=CAM_ASM_000754 /LENGTH=697 /DNA_ID=CAMNT_0043192611 /DNA_START=57 /DNA_END=2150 /DNA_ORIENTATION=-